MVVIAKGIDLGGTLTQTHIDKFKNDGVKFVGRYVKSNSWKTLRPAEAKRITDAGLQILSVFERTADRTKGGAPSGKVDGIEARIHCMELGQPGGSAIYFAVDYDAPQSQYDNIEEYLKAAKAQIGNYKLGVYGSYDVVEEMAKRLPGIYIWQTLAWSRRKISDKAHVFQKQIDTVVNGINIDWNDMYKEAGLWGGKPIVVPDKTTPEKDPAPIPNAKATEVVLKLTSKKGSITSKGFIANGRNYVKLADLALIFGFEKGFNNRTKIATLNGRNVTDGVLIDGDTYVIMKYVVDAFKGYFVWDKDKLELSISKEAFKK